jgi:hypothetical protein
MSIHTITLRQAGAIYSITEHRTEMMFCGPCKYVLDRTQSGQIPSRGIPHHETISDCKRAIEAGCLLCRRLELSKHTDQRFKRLLAEVIHPHDTSQRLLKIYGMPVTTAVSEQVEDCINDEDFDDEKILSQRVSFGYFQLRPVANGKGRAHGICTRIYSSLTRNRSFLRPGLYPHKHRRISRKHGPRALLD